MHELRTHLRTRRIVGAYVDGELPPEAATEVAQHIYACPKCRVTAGTIRLVKRSLQDRHHDLPTIAGYRLRRFAEDLAGSGDLAVPPQAKGPGSDRRPPALPRR
jgi:anti-sigma factor RsiW